MANRSCVAKTSPTLADMSGQRHEWGDWLREQFDRHPTIRIPADLARAAGNKPNGRPVIDPSRITQWLKGQRPSYQLAVIAAEAFGADVPDALEAAGYGHVSPGGRSTTVYGDGSADSAQVVFVGPGPQTPRPVGLGLEDELEGLTDDDIEDVRALIRAKRERRGLA